MKIGYVRVSSRSQNAESQISKIKEYGVDDNHIYTEKKSGRNFTNRPIYQEMRDKVLREGDELVIISLDRLGRNYDEVKKEIATLKTKGIILRILDFDRTLKDYDDNDEMKLINNIILEVIIYMAAKEWEKIHSRQTRGIEEWKKTGKTKTGRPYGRPKRELPGGKAGKDFDKIYELWRVKKEITARQAMETLNLKPNTFYRLVALKEGREVK